MRYAHRLLILAVLLASGCGRPPQIGQENRRLIGSLRTAIATHKTDWLDQNVDLVEQRHAQGSLSDEEYQALREIIEQARAGNWDDAEAAAMRLSKAQQPTAQPGISQPGAISGHRH